MKLFSFENKTIEDLVRSGIHVLLLCLFGIPITHFLVDQTFFWYTKFFFGIPNIFLVDQISFWSSKFLFGQPNFFLVYQNFFLVYQKIRAWPKKIQRLTKVPSMWFWSVSWSTNCPVYFSLFLVDQKNFVQSQGIFGQSLNFFWSGSDFLVY